MVVPIFWSFTHLNGLFIRGFNRADALLVETLPGLSEGDASAELLASGPSFAEVLAEGLNEGGLK